MHEFRLTQISDTHLSRRLPKLTENFHRVSEHIDATNPDLVINTGDLAFDAPTNLDDLEFAKEMHDALPVPCRHLPGNHDIGDNPTAVSHAPKQPATEQHRQNYLAVIGEDRWCFDAAGWSFIGLNSLIMNSGLESETEQYDWLASELGRTNGKPVALFLHKPLFLNTPDDAELASSAVRYVPQPARHRLVRMLDAVDLRLVASGHVHQRRDFTWRRTRHVWAPSTGFILPERIQEVIGVKEVGLVEYRFTPDSVEVRYLKPPGLVDIGLDELLGRS
ncbi:metallophosphoesterase family protein [Bradyrhizobium roseum]|uniref:metallophosphoesterase family protein n=1 Tax=Bradyrhizobium roseum TaxID=3056648 RepID=UPI0026024829|nr:metallophosphoesterase [Bradyrhizobium roseus]WKA26016.1 metallophosphoesterase [Bradyrhizobium roseus]